MKCLKKCLVLAFVLSLFVNTSNYIYAEASSNSIQDGLNSILLEYPNGSYFSVNGKRCEHSSKERCSNCSLSGILAAKGIEMLDTGREAGTCWAFARYISLKLYGWDSLYNYSTQHPNGVKIVAKGATKEAKTFSSARCGDIIWFYKSSACTGNPGHMGIFISADRTGIWLYDSNIGGSRGENGKGGYTGTVRYEHVDYGNIRGYEYCSIKRPANNDTELQTYTVTFDPNGGTVNKKTKTVTAGNEIGTLPTPTRDGYTFLYWSTEKNSSGMVVNENNLIVDQNRTLYACWKENPKEEKFTVTFDYNGGAMRRESKNVLKGDTVGALPALAREGYTLLGWSTNRDGIGMIMRKGNELVVNEDITLYAIWKEDPSTPSWNSHTVRKEQLDLRSMKTTSNDAEGWSWNKETKTLVLNNATIEADALYALRADSATIILEGNSTIKSTYYDVKSGSASTGAKTTAGIYTFSGTLTFEGTGSLTVIGGTSKGGSYGISAYDGQVIVNSGNLTAIGGESTVFATSGIRANRLTVNDGTVVASGGRGNGKLDGGSYGAIVHNNLNVNGGALQLSSGTVGAGALSGSLAGLHGNSSCKINLSSNMAVSDPSGTAVGLYRKNSTIDIREFITILNSQGEPVKDVIIQQKGTSTTPDPKAQPENVWTDWSSWSATPIFASDTRQVETREIKVSDSRTEYRYGGYVTYDGKHDCWCETYLRNKFGSANLRYSDWSTTRYSPNGKGWTCGACGGNHIGIDHYGSDGKAWWAEYVLPDDSYYWEESRTVDAQYETQYRYRDWILV